ncbi:MAG: HNH endonuclease [Candidatus Hydrogenedentes bacterium]|nr:HNH endonuclease [Candidatus Hydrogenedentota bacterium]
MTNRKNIFPLENRIDGLFDTVYPRAKRAPGLHPSGRGCKPLFASALGSLVPGEDKRVLEGRREYFRVDFQDFLDYATSPLPPRPVLEDFPDNTAVFYESLKSTRNEQEVHATWTTNETKIGLSIMDAVIARDKMFLTVIMRFAGLHLTTDFSEGGKKYAFGKTIKSDDGTIADCGITLTLAPDKYTGVEGESGPLGEWERVMWWPPTMEDSEWRISSSGEYTSYLLSEFESDPSESFLSVDSKLNVQDFLAKIRENEDSNHKQNGVFFEVARLGFFLASYIDFMYDLVVTEKKRIGAKSRRRKVAGKKQRSSGNRPVYKIIKSIRIHRPNSTRSIAQETRQWTPPAYSFLVQGHWRRMKEPMSKGRDHEGNTVYGKTWVSTYRKFKDNDPLSFQAEIHTREPKVVIGLKQSLSYARDVIRAYEQENLLMSQEEIEDGPSAAWMADERAKLTANLRYFILNRDDFRCCLCGRSAAQENNVKLEVDHKTPVKRWGRTIEDNLRTLCRDCNRGKSDSL